MKLPIDYNDAVKEWDRFEEYLIKARYAVRNPENGKPLENDLNKVISRVCNEFSSKKVRAAFMNREVISATPFLMNGGNKYTRRSGYYSCYPLGNIDDSTEGIFEMEKDLVTIFQHAGGGGIDISKLRSKGSIVDNGQGIASGPVPFAKGFSHLSARISQGGKRRGALMIQGDYDIEDIEEFITFKGDNPGKYIGCNVSVNITDDKFWEDEKLIRLIAEYIWKSGDPGLLFTKKSLDNTPVPEKYNPVFSNPCGEYLSTKDTACNLLTINLGKCLDPDKAIYLNNVFEFARLAAVAGNEILDMGGFPPIDRIKQNTLKFRPIGIGFTGLHHAMNHFDISYADAENAPIFAKSTQMALMLGSMQGSIDYGTKNEIEPRKWNMTYAEKLEKKTRDFAAGVDELKEWKGRIDQVFRTLNQLGGLFNSVTTSQAPTGSISQLLRVGCTGIEPYYSIIQSRKVKDVDDSFKEFTLVPLEFYQYDQKKLDWVEKQTAHMIDPYQQIRILEACQSFNHTAVSKTINLPAETTIDEIYNFIISSRHSELKGMTLFRDSSMDGILSDASKSSEKKEVQQKTTPILDFSDLAERIGSTHKFKGPVSLYITINRGELGHIREVFLNITKSGSTMHGLCEALGRVISVALQHDFRLVGKISRTLADISSDSVWVNKVLGRIYSVPAALAMVLDNSASNGDKKEPDPYIEPEIYSTYSSCPACGKLSLRRSGGCNQCVSCGYSSC
jgi:ribonucleoside-diphosphate reductase alpha chain